jgi:ABC-type antimicrobial peptide transport system permease subunit
MTTIGWWVRQRTREIGVRAALGATRWQVTRWAGWQGLALTGAGVVIGCLTAMWATRFLQGWLYGVSPLDAPTFVLGAAVMVVVAGAAVFVPVRRAASVDAATALRTE